MNETNRDKSKPARNWRDIVEAQASSGQSAADFCRGHQIGYTTFLYHRDKLKKANQRQVAIASSMKPIPTAGRGGFVPIKLEGNSQWRLRFPGGL